VGFVLAQPRLFLDSSSARDQLPHVLAAAESAQPPPDDELAADLARHDISPLFDGAELERI
jgi:hypothetical protein